MQYPSVHSAREHAISVGGGRWEVGGGRERAQAAATKCGASTAHHLRGVKLVQQQHQSRLFFCLIFFILVAPSQRLGTRTIPPTRQRQGQDAQLTPLVLSHPTHEERRLGRDAQG